MFCGRGAGDKEGGTRFEPWAYKDPKRTHIEECVVWYGACHRWKASVCQDMQQGEGPLNGPIASLVWYLSSQAYLASSRTWRLSHEAPQESGEPKARGHWLRATTGATSGKYQGPAFDGGRLLFRKGPLYIVNSVSCEMLPSVDHNLEQQ